MALTSSTGPPGTSAPTRTRARDAARDELEAQLLAHELRGRVASIAARLDRLLLAEELPARVSTVLTSARADLGDLAVLGDRLVDRAVGHRDVRDVEVVDLAQITRAAAASLERTETRAGQRVRVVGNAPIPVRGVRGDLEFVVANLLGNAVKYSPDGEDVVVRVRSHRSLAILRVSDHGIGLAPADRRRVWEQHFRAQQAHELGVPGSGIGLTLVRRIVEDHQGDITVVSQPARGSTFTVLLPVAASDRP